jgi:hypothetical protein
MAYTVQCAIPAFEGLIPNEHGQHVQDLLFIFAHWHSLAKMKLHTDLTLSILDQWTVMLGDRSRSFVDKTCAAFETHELKREYQSRKRNEARKKGKNANSKASGAAKTQIPDGTAPKVSELSNPTTNESIQPNSGASKPKEQPAAKSEGKKKQATSSTAKSPKAPRTKIGKASLGTVANSVAADSSPDLTGANHDQASTSAPAQPPVVNGGCDCCPTCFSILTYPLPYFSSRGW